MFVDLESRGQDSGANWMALDPSCIKNRTKKIQDALSWSNRSKVSLCPLPFRVSTLNKFRNFVHRSGLKPAYVLHIDLETGASHDRTSYNRDKYSLEKYFDSMIDSSLRAVFLSEGSQWMFELLIDLSMIKENLHKVTNLQDSNASNVT